MSGRILIIDSVATNRIVLKVKLLAAQYRVLACADLAEGRILAASERPDLILLEMTASADAALGFCRFMRQTPALAGIPIIGMGAIVDPQDRWPAFEAGIDDILIKPFNDNLLLARIRSLLRAAGAASELRMRDDTCRALGFAEGPASFLRAGRFIFVTDRITAALPFGNQLCQGTGAEARICEPDSVLRDGSGQPEPDLFLIDGAIDVGVAKSGRLFRLVSELRSRSETRHCSQLVMLPTGQADMGAMALDLGANDVVADEVSPREIALRCRALIGRKLQLDQLRNTVQTGLKAAVTDPLTGLFNRRYAMPHLDGMAVSARETGRDLAVLAVDIDHFKKINDTYGHAAGDRILHGIAQLLRDNMRSVDLVARIGGEEFLIAMPDTTPEQARSAAERLRGIVAAHGFAMDMPGNPVNVTLSIGVALATQSGVSEDSGRIMARADIALYAAKAAGRNTVEISQPAAA